MVSPFSRDVHWSRETEDQTEVRLACGTRAKQPNRC